MSRKSKLFVQHVGEQLAKRDFPRSIGEPNIGMRFFRKEELLSWQELTLIHLPISGLEEPSTGWQIWWLPDGAEQVISDMDENDWLILKSSEGECDYIGRVRLKAVNLSGVSKRIWGDEKFTSIALLDESRFINLTWGKFCERIGYKETYTLRGKTSSVSQAKLEEAGFIDGADFAYWCRGHNI